MPPAEGARNGDFYVYVLAHAYKHFTISGTGIRTLADVWIMNRHFGDSLDRGYVDGQLKQLELADFEKGCRELADRLFAISPCEKDGHGRYAALTPSELPVEEQEILNVCLGTGTYGSIDRLVENKLKTMQEKESGKPILFSTKLRYLLNRLFPGMDWIREYYPFFASHPYLIPALWFWRIVSKTPLRIRRICRELKLLIHVK